MAISRASNSSIQGGLPKFNDLWDGTTATSAFDSLGSVLIGSSGQLSVTFSNIPQTYTHLQLRIFWRDNRSNAGDGSYADLTFNGITTTSYSYHQLYGVGTNTTGAAQNSSYANIELTRMADNGATSGIFGQTIVDILDYTSTNKTKTIRAIGGYDTNSKGSSYLYSGGWYSTPAAITSLSIIDGGGTLFLENSHFALYGIK